jgi:MFS family permease
MFPTTFSLVPASIIVGAVITRINHFRWAIWAGWLVTTLAAGLMVLWNVHTSTPVWAVILVLLGIGHGLVLNAQNFATQAIAQPRYEAAAAAMYAFLRSFGMALGVGIGGSTFQNVMKVKLVHLGLPVEIARNAESYIAVLETLPSDSVFKSQVLESYVYGLRGVFGLYCGMAGLAGITSLLIQHFDLNKELESEHKLVENRISRMINHGTVESV